MNGHFMKRQRGRGRKPGGGGGGGGGGHQPNRTLESNGPDVKIRGSAAHIYEKYVQLSRDAASAGDRIMSESYAQFAEHYFRMLRAMQPQTPVYEPQRFGQDLDYDQEGEEGEEAEGGAEGGEAAEAGPGGEQPYGGGYRGQEQRPQRFQQRHPYQQRGPRQPYEGQPQEGYARSEGGQPASGEAQAGGGEGQPGEAQDDGFRGQRRRRHRGRFRPQEGGGRQDDGRGEDGQGDGPVEGFGDSVPAFVGNE
ncbi:MAG: DUF4167 domain-containing protein [Hyphomonadaceae bacterium]